MAKQTKEVYLSAKQVVEQGLIPWILSIPTLTKWIRRQMKNPEQSPIKVLVRGKGNGARYFILKSSLKGIKRTKGPVKGIVKI